MNARTRHHHRNHHSHRILAGLAAAALVLTLPASALAGPRESQLDNYAAAAKVAGANSSAFAGFSAARGKTLHTTAFAGGKPDTPACTSCHGKEARDSGRTPAGKAIEPMALSATPARYTDPAKVEKWFKRNCNEVLGRECSAQEKGDWLSFMLAQ